MRVLISGAGPAGLALAYWLKRYGFVPVLLEKAPALRQGGYNLDIRGRAVDVVKMMGIYNDLVKAATHIKTAQLIDANGKVLQSIKSSVLRHHRNEDVEIKRDAICRILADQLSEVEIIFDDSIRSIEQNDEIVRIAFKKNSSREFDLVIGADGLHSTVRNFVFGDEEKFFRNFQICYCIFTIPNYLGLDCVEMQYTEFGKMMGMWCTRKESSITVSFAFASSLMPPENHQAQKQFVHDTFKNLSGEVPMLLNKMMNSSDFYFDVTGQVHMDHWSLGRVALLGDAAYCSSPSSGQGLSLALVGAYVLAGELARSQGNYSTAFEQYEKELQLFVKKNQEMGVKGANIFKLQQKNNLLTFLLMKLIRFFPGKLITVLSYIGSKRIHRVANAIILKNYN